MSTNPKDQLDDEYAPGAEADQVDERDDTPEAIARLERPQRATDKIQDRLLFSKRLKKVKKVGGFR